MFIAANNMNFSWILAKLIFLVSDISLHNIILVPKKYHPGHIPLLARLHGI